MGFLFSSEVQHIISIVSGNKKWFHAQCTFGWITQSIHGTQIQPLCASSGALHIIRFSMLIHGYYVAENSRRAMHRSSASPSIILQQTIEHRIVRKYIDRIVIWSFCNITFITELNFVTYFCIIYIYVCVYNNKDKLVHTPIILKTCPFFITVL